jgi:hypothetical protein
MSLISTSDLRVWMGIEEVDKKPNPKLASISQAVEDFVDSYTNRKLEAQVYRTHSDYCYLDGNGRRWMYLPQYPISYITEIAIDSERLFGSGTLVPSADFFWYPSGKVVSEGEYFARGRRNIRVDFVAGYAPVVGGTHNAVVSSYPIPQDLKQVMIEMCVQSFKEGMTAVHTVGGDNASEPKFIQMLSRNSFWKNVLNKYKAFDASLGGYEE